MCILPYMLVRRLDADVAELLNLTSKDPVHLTKWMNLTYVTTFVSNVMKQLL
jgi:hypothetical protein